MSRSFFLNRKVDETGISGTGRVAEGVLFRNGKCVISWLTEHTSVAVYDSMGQVVAIHGHNGKTEVVFDGDHCRHCGHHADFHCGDGLAQVCESDLVSGIGPACDCVLLGHEDRCLPWVKR